MGQLSYHWAAFPLHQKCGKENWINEVLGYLIERYTPLEERLRATFRYVDCDSRNLGTSSYEYSSIVRDAGSIFGSVMDELLGKTGAKPINKQQFTIKDYKKWLADNLQDITRLSVEMPIQREFRYLIPFSALNDPCEKLCWWDTQNDLKHSDFIHFRKGNLQNAINGAASVASLFMLMIDGNPANYVHLFYNIGYRTPIEQLEQSLLCAS